MDSEFSSFFFLISNAYVVIKFYIAPSILLMLGMNHLSIENEFRRAQGTHYPILYQGVSDWRCNTREKDRLNTLISNLFSSYQMQRNGNFHLSHFHRSVHYHRQLRTVKVSSVDQVPWGTTHLAIQKSLIISSLEQVITYWIGLNPTASLETIRTSSGLVDHYKTAVLGAPGREELGDDMRKEIKGSAGKILRGANVLSLAFLPTRLLED